MNLILALNGVWIYSPVMCISNSQFSFGKLLFPLFKLFFVSCLPTLVQLLRNGNLEEVLAKRRKNDWVLKNVWSITTRSDVLKIMLLSYCQMILFVTKAFYCLRKWFSFTVGQFEVRMLFRYTSWRSHGKYFMTRTVNFRKNCTKTLC